MNNLIVFDLDGVITSEEAYWDAAGLTLHELLYSPRYWDVDGNPLGVSEQDKQYRPAETAEESRCISRAVLPEAEILALKARAINSNWDVCYAAVCLHLINLLALLPDISALLPLRPWDAGWLAAFRKQISGTSVGHPQGVPLHFGNVGAPLAGARSARSAGLNTHLFDTPIFKGYVGLELINRLDVYASEVLGHPVKDVFSRYSPLWALCRDIFQEWYLGDELYSETYGHPPGQRGKPGCVHFERPLLPPEEIGATLEALSEQGYVLGFATGRTYQEAAYPLKMYGLLRYFDEQHIATYDNIERAEAELRSHGDQTLLSKPHPFQFLVAAGLAQPSPAMQSEPFVVVGDSTSDILGGRAAGALTVAVLTGARTPEARQLLEQSGPDFIIDDMTKLPELLVHIDSLATIQRLQFTEREKAERLLRRWFARHMHLKAESVTLMPKAVSLNSFNGFYRLNGEEYFFKTHVEEQGVLEEYYHAELLHKAGYNIVRPLQTLHEEGRQMVVYPVVHWPVMFDLVRAVELGKAEDISAEMLVAAEKRECERLLSIYTATLAYSTAEENARAPIHQLFWHRLTGGRLKSFYEGKLVSFPRSSYSQDAGILFEELLNYRWIINGKEHQRTLGELIERARVVLNPACETMTVTGHGDAHFGNVFLEEQKDYLYFDPAFAGHHAPLLDIIKPLFHNVFAAWMYFPHEIALELQLSVTTRDTNIYVEHNYDLVPVRQAIFHTKLEYLLAPLLQMLRSREALLADWMEIVPLALMCCPLLTINLLDRERMPAAISWLGLTQVIEMGNLSIPGGIHI
ncbi:MAG: HAD family hydrolase [Ktedonobacteraceae bacterium]